MNHAPEEQLSEILNMVIEYGDMRAIALGLIYEGQGESEAAKISEKAGLLFVQIGYKLATLVTLQK